MQLSSHGFLKKCGITHKNIIGKHIASLWGGHEINLKRKFNELYSNAGGETTIEIIADNKKFKIIVFLTPIKVVKGFTSQYAVFIDLQKSDKTESFGQIEIEDEKQKRISLIKKVGYDIRTPLNIISGFSDLLISGLENPQQIKYIGAVKDAVRNIVGIITDIHDFVKIESGILKIVKDTMDLRKLLANVEAAFKESTSNSDIHFTINTCILAIINRALFNCARGNNKTHYKQS